MNSLVHASCATFTMPAEHGVAVLLSAHVPGHRAMPGTMRRARELLSSALLPHSNESAPESSALVPHSNESVPESSGLVPHSNESVPESSSLVPHSKKTVPGAHAVALDRTRVQGAVTLYLY